jgi:N-acetylglutamate synthase-like GNAT family acetyltransferase
MISVDTSKRDLSEINAFYAQFDYRGTVSRDDIIVAATDEERLIGIARLCSEENVSVLRGMYILPAYQRQGVGTRMLHQFDKLIGKKECWSIALAYLENFYGQIGFRFIEERKAPPHLLARIESYRIRNRAANSPKENRIMFRPAS